MNKFAAEQNAIVEAMSKIASANGLPLTYPVAQRIAELHQYSPVLIMKTAADTMTPEEALQWQTYRANLGPNMITGLVPGVGPLIGAAVTPGWSGALKHTLLPNLIGAGLGAGAGVGAGLLAGDPAAAGLFGAMGATVGGALGSYVGGRHYAPNGPATPDLWNNNAMFGQLMGAPIAVPLGIRAHNLLPEEARFR